MVERREGEKGKLVSGGGDIADEEENKQSGKQFQVSIRLCFTTTITVTLGTTTNSRQSI